MDRDIDSARGDFKYSLGHRDKRTYDHDDHDDGSGHKPQTVATVRLVCLYFISEHSLPSPVASLSALVCHLICICCVFYLEDRKRERVVFLNQTDLSSI